MPLPGMPFMPPPGAPPMGGPMMPPSGGMPLQNGGPPMNPSLQALQSLGGMQAPSREKRAMQEASARVQIAMTGVSTRSAKAAEHLGKAFQEIQKAIQIMEELGSAPVGPPPNFLGGVPTPMGQGTQAPLL